MIMLGKISGLFKKKPSAEQIYLEEHKIKIDPVLGFIIDGVVLKELTDKLVFFSNRKVSAFEDLENLFYRGILIKEKIDLELNTGSFTARVGNNEENLKQFRHYIVLLNDYYRLFVREK